MQCAEQVGLEIVEHRLGGARWLWPVHAYATDRRIIMIRCHLLRRHTIKMMRYDHITEVEIEKGILFCQIHLSLIGEHADHLEAPKWLVDISHRNAVAFALFINSIQEKKASAIDIKAQ